MSDRYARGLLLVRRVLEVDGLDVDNVWFAPEVGQLRHLYVVAYGEVSDGQRQRIELSRAHDVFSALLALCLAWATL